MQETIAGSATAAAPNMIRILLADDHVLVAQAIGALLSQNNGFHVDTAGNFPAVLEALAGPADYDLVLLDLQMPGVSGLDSVKRAVEASKGGKVALFTANASKHIVKRSLELGVGGVIPKTLPLNSLESVIRLILSGQVFVQASMLESDEDTEGLSEIELTVLRLAADGRTNKGIANEIGSNETTIKMHMRAICRKLGARNRAHAAVIARNSALIEDV